MKIDAYANCPIYGRQCVPETCEFGIEVRSEDNARKLSKKKNKRYTTFACSMKEFFIQGIKVFKNMGKSD